MQHESSINDINIAQQEAGISNLVVLETYKMQKYGIKCQWCGQLVNTHTMKIKAFICYESGAHISVDKRPSWVDDKSAQGITIFGGSNDIA